MTVQLGLTESRNGRKDNLKLIFIDGKHDSGRVHAWKSPTCIETDLWLRKRSPVVLREAMCMSLWICNLYEYGGLELLRALQVLMDLAIPLGHLYDRDPGLRLMAGDFTVYVTLFVQAR